MSGINEFFDLHWFKNKNRCKKLHFQNKLVVLEQWENCIFVLLCQIKTLFPSGKNYRPRKHDHADVKSILSKAFSVRSFLDPATSASIREKTGLSAFCIKTWFKQKRKSYSGLKKEQKVSTKRFPTFLPCL